MDPLLLQTLSEIKRDIRELNEKVDGLGVWKNRVVGGSIVLSGLVTGLFCVLELVLRK